MPNMARKARTLIKGKLFFLSCLGAIFIGSSAFAQSADGLLNNNTDRIPRHIRDNPPLVIVPPQYQGTVEIYMTPNGYMVRTRPFEGSPYPALNKQLQQGSPQNIESEYPKKTDE